MDRSPLRAHGGAVTLSPSESVSVARGEHRFSGRGAFGFWAAGATYLVLLAGTNVPTPLYRTYQVSFGFGDATLTAVFAVYVAALIPSLLVAGPLADAIGRRTVLVPAIALAAAGAALLAAAQGTAWLYVGRLVQGLALGAASGAVTALLVEREPRGDRRRGAMVAALAAVAGVGFGPLLGGVVAQYLPEPTVLPYLVEIALLLAALIATATTPDTRATTPYRPRRPSVPAEIRAVFVTSGATSFVTWAVTAIFLTLVPTYAATFTHSANLALDGAVVAILFACSGATQRAASKRGAVACERFGLLALVAGLGLLVGAGVASSIWLLLAASVVAGVGQGLAFLGAMTEINGAAPPDRHAEILSGFYVVTYLGTGIPVIGVGFLAGALGLLRAVEIFCAAASVAAAVLFLVLTVPPSAIAVPRARLARRTEPTASQGPTRQRRRHGARPR